MTVSLPRLRAAQPLHLLIVALLLLSSAVLLGLGSWLHLLRPGGRYLSLYTSSWPFLALGIILFLLFVFHLVLLVVLPRRSTAAPRPPFITAGVLILLLAATAVVGFSLLGRGIPIASAATEAESLWRADVSAPNTNTTTSPPSSNSTIHFVCDVERVFDCRGFNYGECFCSLFSKDSAPVNASFDPTSDTTAAGKDDCAERRGCAVCPHPVGHNRGCFDRMVRNLRVVLIPVSALAAALAVLLAVLVLTACCALDRAAPTEILPVDVDAT